MFKGEGLLVEILSSVWLEGTSVTGLVLIQIFENLSSKAELKRGGEEFPAVLWVFSLAALL